MRVEIVAEAFAPEKELAAFTRSGHAGALASFVGYCRAESHTGPVERIELEHYPGFTEAHVSQIARAVCDRDDILDILVIHRVGVIPAGEAIVLVAALSAHRAPALDAVGTLMDYLKTEAPIWKREVVAGAGRWIEPTAEDRQAVARRRELQGVKT